MVRKLSDGVHICSDRAPGIIAGRTPDENLSLRVALGVDLDGSHDGPVIVLHRHDVWRMGMEGIGSGREGSQAWAGSSFAFKMTAQRRKEIHNDLFVL